MTKKFNPWDHALRLPANHPNKNRGAFGYGDERSYVCLHGPKRKEPKT